MRSFNAKTVIATGAIVAWLSLSASSALGAGTYSDDSSSTVTFDTTGVAATSSQPTCAARISIAEPSTTYTHLNTPVLTDGIYYFAFYGNDGRNAADSTHTKITWNSDTCGVSSGKLSIFDAYAEYQDNNVWTLANNDADFTDGRPDYFSQIMDLNGASHSPDWIPTVGTHTGNVSDSVTSLFVQHRLTFNQGQLPDIPYRATVTYSVLSDN